MDTSLGHHSRRGGTGKNWLYRWQASVSALCGAISEQIGWGTWIRTRTNGVRVRGSTVNLFPSAAAIGDRLAGRRVEHECFSPFGQGPLPIWCRLLSYSPRRSIPRDDQLPRIESVILSMEFTGRAAAASWFRPPRRYSGYRRRVRKRHEPPFHVGKHDRDRKKAPEAA